MENENPQKIFALLLCFALLVLYKQSVLDPYLHGTRPGAGTQVVAPTPNPPSSLETSPPNTLTNTPANTQPNSSTAVDTTSRQATTGATSPAAPSDEEINAHGEIQIQTAKYHARITLMGGRLKELLLNDYAEHVGSDSPQLNLVRLSPGSEYPLGLLVGNVDDARVQYQLITAPKELESRTEHGSYVFNGAQTQSFTFEGSLLDGRKISKTLTFSNDSYLVDLDIRVTGSAQPPAVELRWSRYEDDNDTRADRAHYSYGFVAFDGEKTVREPLSKFAKDQQKEFTFPAVKWISLAEKYFLATLIIPDGTGDSRAQKEESVYTAGLKQTGETTHFRMYLGPKNYQLLQELGMELQRNLDLGRTGFIAAPLLWFLHAIFGALKNYGLAIIALTIFVKCLLYPLTSASYKQMKRMQELQPEMKRIQESVKDKQQQQMEVMAMYKKHQVNPLGGCLPIFVQMPVFIGLYTALDISLELRHAPFAFWIKDLSAPESLHLFGLPFGIPIMVILFVISMLVQQWMTPAPGMDPAQRKMMMFMPLIFGAMFASMPAGLTLYWLTNNIISIGQQQALQGRIKGIPPITFTALVASGVFLLAFLLVHISPA